MGSNCLKRFANGTCSSTLRTGDLKKMEMAVMVTAPRGRFCVVSVGAFSNDWRHERYSRCKSTISKSGDR